MDMHIQPVMTPAHPRIMGERPTRISAKNVDIYYGEKHAIKSLSVEIPDRAVSAFIGIGLRQVNLPARHQPHE